MATTSKGYPYPVGTDRVMDGDDAIKALAEQVDLRLPARVWVGTATVSVSSAAAANATVTFPAGRFTAAPRVFAITRGASTWYAYANTATAADCSIGVRSATAQTASVPVDIFAVQMLATGADG